uniref:Uncharacterized protein n=1 Tax=Glossina pallidipes TaxID=7398 RepID=A0A1A9Z4N4_GLOPL
MYQAIYLCKWVCRICARKRLSKTEKFMQRCGLGLSCVLNLAITWLIIKPSFTYGNDQLSMNVGDEKKRRRRNSIRSCGILDMSKQLNPPTTNSLSIYLMRPMSRSQKISENTS